MHQTDLKKSWKVIKNIIGKDDNRSCTQHNDFLLNNQYISDDTIIANAFNNYFISVGRSLAKNIRSDTNPILYVKRIESSLHIPEIQSGEVLTIISAITNSASGYDELPASILKQCINIYIEPLTHLINMSFIKALFPNLSKQLELFLFSKEKLNNSYTIIDQYQCYLFIQKCFFTNTNLDSERITPLVMPL